MNKLFKFNEKNIAERSNSVGAPVEASTIGLVFGKDLEIAKAQSKDYETIKDYIEGVVDTDSIVRPMPHMEQKRLTNYTISFDNNQYVHVKDKVSGFVYGVFSLGNKKLVSGKEVQFLIFNILQRITCPNATEGCKKFCYANKSNCCYTLKGSHSRNSRLNNVILTMYSNFEEIVTEVIEYVKQFTNKKIVFRFHESGDIYSREYWEKIKRIMNRHEEVKFMFYTKSVFVLSEINEVNSKENVSLRYSLDSTSHDAVVEKCYELNCPTFIVIDKESTKEAVENISDYNMCNILAGDKRELLRRIEELEKALELETRKTYKKKIQIEINNLNKSMIDTRKTCTNCLKCLNKSALALYVATH